MLEDTLAIPCLPNDIIERIFKMADDTRLALRIAPRFVNYKEFDHIFKNRHIPLDTNDHVILTIDIFMINGFCGMEEAIYPRSMEILFNKNTRETFVGVKEPDLSMSEFYRVDPLGRVCA